MLVFLRRVAAFFREYVLNNWRYKLSALAAAVIIWIYVAGQQSMQVVYQVPIYFQNIPTNIILDHPPAQQIQITLSGRRDRILSLKERQIWVAIDLSRMKAGKNLYAISRSNIVAPSGLEIKAISPRKILINLQEVKEESHS